MWRRNGTLCCLIASTLCVYATPEAFTTSSCAIDSCFQRIKSASSRYISRVSSFCESYITSTPGTQTSTFLSTKAKTITTYISPPPVTVYTTSTTTTTTSTGTLCTTTVTSDFPYNLTTFVQYRSQSHPAASSTSEAPPAEKRDGLDEPPPWMTADCGSHGASPSRISSACSCFLTSGTDTATVTTTSIYTSVVTKATATRTKTKTLTEPSTTTYCIATSTSTMTKPFTCGTAYTSVPTSSTSGSVKCTPPAASPSTNGLLRIESNDADGTIFEGCIVSSPRNITTPSGGTHPCDGTNGGSNPDPKNTPTDQLDQAAIQYNFDYDGTFSASFDDFFITRISTTSQTSSQFWGVLLNYIFLPVGGCQQELKNRDTTLWLFDVFNANYSLKVVPEYAAGVVGVGGFEVTVFGEDRSGGRVLVKGAEIAGQVTDRRGRAVVMVPEVPGCYQYKATYEGTIRSNAFYLAAFPAFGFDGRRGYMV